MENGSLPQRRGLKCELAYCDLDNNYEAEHSKQASKLLPTDFLFKNQTGTKIR